MTNVEWKNRKDHIKETQPNREKKKLTSQLNVCHKRRHSFNMKISGNSTIMKTPSSSSNKQYFYLRRWRTHELRKKKIKELVSQEESEVYFRVFCYCVVYNTNKQNTLLSRGDLWDGPIPCPQLRTVVCQSVWSRNLKDEAAMTRVGLLREGKKENSGHSVVIILNVHFFISVLFCKIMLRETVSTWLEYW
jgi:hypothetical protein